MKLHGKKLSERNVVTIFIPRANGADIVLKAAAVLSYKEFDAVCPYPVPPVKIARGGAKVPDFEDKNFKTAVNQYSRKKSDWMTMQSLLATPGLEIESVKMDDPSTWANWQAELTEAGFSDMELMRILSAVTEANGLNEQKIEEARERFLAGTASETASPSTSPTQEQPSTPSGELAKSTD